MTFFEIQKSINRKFEVCIFSSFAHFFDDSIRMQFVIYFFCMTHKSTICDFFFCLSCLNKFFHQSIFHFKFLTVNVMKSKFSSSFFEIFNDGFIFQSMTKHGESDSKIFDCGVFVNKFVRFIFLNFPNSENITDSV